MGGWTGSEGRGCRAETSVSMSVSKCKQRWRKKQNKRVEIVEIEQGSICRYLGRLRNTPYKQYCASLIELKVGQLRERTIRYIQN